MTDAVISALHVYPVKGCRRLAPAVVDVAVTGLSAGGLADREWMVVDAAGRFVTQREFPRLALVRPELRGDALALAAPGGAEVVVPLAAAPVAARAVVVWNSDVRGLDAGDPAAAWLSAWLGTRVRLVRFDRTQPRACNPQYAGTTGAHTYFADGYPVLVIGEASLADLNARLAARGHPPLPMDRFRPNVVVRGLPPFAEDHVDTLAAGDVVLHMVKPCTRCRVTATDQSSAEVGTEPLATLGEFRMDARWNGVTFGMNAVVVAGAGATLATGTPVAATYRF